jgi:hypothetical protein
MKVRSLLLLGGLVAVGCVFGLAYSWIVREDEGPELAQNEPYRRVADEPRAVRPDTTDAPSSAAPRPATPAPESGASPVGQNAPPAVVTPDAIARWTSDAMGGDAGKRAEAIISLAAAPRAEALPVLSRVLMNGEPTVDRPLALRSLRDLALSQGDTDGTIRDAVREVIYHGDDETLADGAHEVLDIIEESEAR